MRQSDVMGGFPAVNYVEVSEAKRDCSRLDCPQDCHILKTEALMAQSGAGGGPRPLELTTPNLLTLFRIAPVPVLVWLLMFTGPGPSAMAAGVFFLATI